MWRNDRNYWNSTSTDFKGSRIIVVDSTANTVFEELFQVSETSRQKSGISTVVAMATGSVKNTAKKNSCGGKYSLPQEKYRFGKSQTCQKADSFVPKKNIYIVILFKIVQGTASNNSKFTSRALEYVW